MAVPCIDGVAARNSLNISLRPKRLGWTRVLGVAGQSQRARFHGICASGLFCDLLTSNGYADLLGRNHFVI